MSADARFRRGVEAAGRGDHAAAEAAFGEAIEAGERAGEALRARAAARARLGNWGGAADDLERWFRQDPGALSPVDLEYARVLRTAQSLPADRGRRLVADFGFEALAEAVALRLAGKFVSVGDFVARAGRIAEEKYAAAPPEALQGYLAAKIPGRLYRVPALQALPAMTMWSRCEWWVWHGLGAADAVHEIVAGGDETQGEPKVAPPPYRQGCEPHHLAVRSPIEWAFVHHALLVMAYDLADDLADDHPGLRAELPAVRDAVVKPLVYLGFGIGLESQGV